MAKKKITINERMLSLVSSFQSNYANGVEVVHEAMYEIDLRYYRASKLYLKECQANVDKCKIDPHHVPDLENVTPPLVMSQTEQAVAYLAGLFAAKNSIFTPIGQPEKQDHIEGIEKVIASYDREHQWKPEVIAMLRDIVKYNISASLWEWQEAPDSNATNFFRNDRGIHTKSLPLYDCVWDTETPLHKFQLEGMFFRYDNFISTIKANFYIRNLENKHLTVAGLKVKKGLQTLSDNKHSRINPINTLNSFLNELYTLGNSGATSGSDWNLLGNKFLGLGDLTSGVKVNTFSGIKYSIVHIRTSGHELLGTAGDHELAVFKLITVNDSVVIYSEKLQLPFLEVIMGTGFIDKINPNNSVVSSITNYQDLAAKLIRARLSAARSEIHNHGIFNPRFIRPEDINNPADALKVPLRKGAWFDPEALNKAYKEIPYRNGSAHNLVEEASMLTGQFTNDATGISQFRQSPVRGNKSVGQFRLESQAADGRLFLLASTIEGTTFSKIKKLVKIHLLVKKPQIPGFEIDWEAISTIFDFSINDGLTQLGILDDMDNLRTFINASAQNPQLAPLVVEMLDFVLKVSTPYKMSDFVKEEAQRTPEPQLPEDQLPEGEQPQQGGTPNDNTQQL